MHSALSKWVSYCGSFKSNRFEGEGTLSLQANERFLGKFICGMACGEGTLYRYVYLDLVKMVKWRRAFGGTMNFFSNFDFIYVKQANIISKNRQFPFSFVFFFTFDNFSLF